MNSTRFKSRRLFLQSSLTLSAGLGASCLSASTAASALTSAEPEHSNRIKHGPDRILRLANAHTWEKVDVVYWTQGMYIDESMTEISHLMRDHRANKSITMDEKVIDNLYGLYQLMGTDERIHILSGYRTPETNAKLRQRSSGVAKYSLHMEGRAIDLNIPGKTAKQIRDAAISLKTGGVGYYPAAGFVHIDTGAVRNWGQS